MRSTAIQFDVDKKETGGDDNRSNSSSSSSDSKSQETDDEKNTRNGGSASSADFKSLYLVYDKNVEDWVKEYQIDHTAKRQEKIVTRQEMKSDVPEAPVLR